MTDWREADEETRNLLLGLLALHEGWLDESQLINTYSAWVQTGSDRFEAMLSAYNRLDTSQLVRLFTMAADVLKRHQGDLHACAEELGQSALLSLLQSRFGRPDGPPVSEGVSGSETLDTHQLQQADTVDRSSESPPSLKTTPHESARPSSEISPSSSQLDLARFSTAETVQVSRPSASGSSNFPLPSHNPRPDDDGGSPTVNATLPTRDASTHAAPPPNEGRSPLSALLGGSTGNAGDLTPPPSTPDRFFHDSESAGDSPQTPQVLIHSSPPNRNTPASDTPKGCSPEPPFETSTIPAHFPLTSEARENQQTRESLTGNRARWALSTPQRFQIGHFFKSGGLGDLFHATDRKLDRPVVAKFIKPSKAIPKACREFIREAKITGSLEHPGVVPVYDLDNTESGLPFYTMRLIDGESLEDHLKPFHQLLNHCLGERERRVRYSELLIRFMDVCDTIAYAHSRGIVHRDIKPANIMIGRYGETIVLDWGLARRVRRVRELFGDRSAVLASVSAVSPSDSLEEAAYRSTRNVSAAHSSQTTPTPISPPKQSVTDHRDAGGPIGHHADERTLDQTISSTNLESTPAADSPSHSASSHQTQSHPKPPSDSLEETIEFAHSPLSAEIPSMSGSVRLDPGMTAAARWEDGKLVINNPLLTQEDEDEGDFIKGTPEFMSPEQALGLNREIDHYSDIYSLGVTLYQVLVGRKAFGERGTEPLESVLQKVIQGIFPPPRAVNPHVPRPLEAICLKAMATAPQDRYASVRDLKNDLSLWIADEPVSAYREPWYQRLFRHYRKHQSSYQAAVAAIAVLIAALIVFGLALGTIRTAEKDRADVRLWVSTESDQQFQELTRTRLSPNGSKSIPISQIEPLLIEQLRTPQFEKDRSRRVRAAVWLALFATAPPPDGLDYNREFLTHLDALSPQQIPTLVELFQQSPSPRRDAIRRQLEQWLAQEQTNNPGRLQAAALLCAPLPTSLDSTGKAAIVPDPTSPAFEYELNEHQVAWIVADLVEQPIGEIQSWTRLFLNQAERIRPRLLSDYRQTKTSQQRFILIEYYLAFCENDLSALVDPLPFVASEDFVKLFNALRRRMSEPGSLSAFQREAIIQRLRAAASSTSLETTIRLQSPQASDGVEIRFPADLDDLIKRPGMVWSKRGWVAADLDHRELERLDQALSRRGYRLIRCRPWRSSLGLRFAGVWDRPYSDKPRSPSWELEPELDPQLNLHSPNQQVPSIESPVLKTHLAKRRAEGWRLIDASFTPSHDVPNQLPTLDAVRLCLLWHRDDPSDPPAPTTTLTLLPRISEDLTQLIRLDHLTTSDQHELFLVLEEEGRSSRIVSDADLGMIRALELEGEAPIDLTIEPVPPAPPHQTELIERLNPLLGIEAAGGVLKSNARINDGETPKREKRQNRVAPLTYRAWGLAMWGLWTRAGRDVLIARSDEMSLHRKWINDAMIDAAADREVEGLWRLQGRLDHQPKAAHPEAAQGVAWGRVAKIVESVRPKVAKTLLEGAARALVQAERNGFGNLPKLMGQTLPRAFQHDKEFQTMLARLQADQTHRLVLDNAPDRRGYILLFDLPRPDHASAQLATLPETLAAPPDQAIPTTAAVLNHQGRIRFASVWQQILPPPETCREPNLQLAQTALALLLLDHDELALRSLRLDADPTLRHRLIERLETVMPELCARDHLLPLLSRLANPNDFESVDPGIVQGLILALEALTPHPQRDDASSPPPDAIELLKRIHRDHPHAGVHSAAEWLLNRWGQQSYLNEFLQSRAGRKPDEHFDWMVNSAGMTMIRIRVPREPIEVGLAPPELILERPREERLRYLTRRHRLVLPIDFAVSAHEVRLREYRRSLGRDSVNDSKGSGDIPAQSLSLTEALRFCQWLNHCELADQPNALPPYQRDNPTPRDTNFNEPVLDELILDDHWRVLGGYRPWTRGEAEYATRAGSTGLTFFGDDLSLADRYVWFADNTELRPKPVGLSRPNAWGLFDTLGNMSEWTFTPRDDVDLNRSLGRDPLWDGRSIRPDHPFTDETLVEVMATSFRSNRSELRSGLVFQEGFGRLSEAIGFRVARGLPEGRW